MELRTILYYPKLYPQEGLWLRACVMHFDRIASIVPCQAAQEKIPPYLRALEEAGVYEALDPKKLFEDRLLFPAFMRDLNRDMRKRRIISKQYYTHRKERFDAVSRTPALLKKQWIPFMREELPAELLEMLLSIGVLMEDKAGTLWMNEEEMATQIYYAMMARYLAYRNSNYMLMGTDALQYHTYPFGEAQDALSDMRILYMNILMQRVLPVPAESVPLADIIAFCDANREELQKLDLLLDGYVNRIYRCKNVEKLRELTYQYQEELEFGLDNFLYYLEKGGIPYKMHSIKQIIPLGIHPAVENSKLRGLDAPVLVTSATRETELLVQFKAQINKEAAWSGLESERALYLYDGSQSLVSMRE